MGGRSSSRSSNQTSNTNVTRNQTETINAAITGDLDEGALAVSGRNNTVFQSDNSRVFNTDIRSEIDNSQRFDIETDIDNSQRFDIETDIDNSQQFDIGDGSINGTGNSITLNQVDQGLIEGAVSLSEGAFGLVDSVIAGFSESQANLFDGANALAANSIANVVAAAGAEPVRPAISNDVIKTGLIVAGLVGATGLLRA